MINVIGLSAGGRLGAPGDPYGRQVMLEPLLESTAKERILLYLHTHGEAYPREISRALGLYLNTVRNQLLKLERGGVLYSRLMGKVRLFGINPRYAFKKELKALLEKAMIFIPASELEKTYKPRLRPRLTGKPLLRPRQS